MMDARNSKAHEAIDAALRACDGLTVLEALHVLASALMGSCVGNGLDDDYIADLCARTLRFARRAQSMSTVERGRA